MLERQFEQLAKIQEKYPFVIILLMVLVTVFFGYYAVNLKTDSSFDTMFGPESDHMYLKNIVSNEFGSTDQIFVLVTLDNENNDKTGVQDIREPEVLVAIDRLAASLEDESSVDSVFTLPFLLKLTYGRLPETLDESKEMINGLDLDTDSFLSSDFTALNMLVNIDIPNKPGSTEKAQAIMEEKVEEAAIPVGVKVILTGEPPLINRIMNLLISDNLRTILFAIAAIVFILWFFFRSPSLAVIGTLPVIMTLVWLAGTMVLLDFRLTMMTAAVGAMMVGMGVDYSIHMTHGFQERVKKGKKHAARLSVRDVGGALVTSALTTVAGFIAMLAATGPSAKTQGLILATGVTYAFLTSVLALPAFLVAHRKIAYSDLDNILFKLGEEKKEKNRVKLVLGKLAHFQANHPGMILICFIIATVLLIPGMGLLRFDTDNDNWIPPGDPVFASIQEVEFKFGGLDSQNYLVMIDPETAGPDTISDLRDPDLLQTMAEIETILTAEEFVDSVDSPLAGIREAHNGKIPQDIDIIRDTVAANPQLESYYGRDFTIMRFSIRSDSLDIGEGIEANYDTSLREIETVGVPDGLVIVGQGGGASDKEINELLQGDTMKTTLLGFVLVFLVAFGIYRSFTVGLLAFVPVIIAVIWTIGIMGYIDLPFTVLTSGMLSIVMGIGIDFSIHIIHNTRLILKKGKSMAEAIAHSLTTTGEAIFVSTATTALGFLSLTLAVLLATQRLGFTLAIAISSAFIACIILVPATLALQEKFSKKEVVK